ncbi:MAG: shikimate dehydrogenase [Balneola sp.]|nr:MAG: shikimate dehydrogenase [Balneola sp.]
MTFSEFKNSQYSQKPHYLLIGNPVSHSVSPIMHNTALQFHAIEAEYHAIAVSMGELSSLISHFNSPNFLGANITLPHKQNLFEVVDSHTITASSIGAINTIIKRDEGLIGENTDAYGFLKPLEKYLNEIDQDRAIVFGAGGATKAINYALNDLGFEEVVLVSRKPERYQQMEGTIMCNYDLWTEFAEDASLIVNATPLGMVPNTTASPVKASEISFLEGKICYDIVYNPRETTFLKQAKQVDAFPIGGLGMLIHQGAKSFKEWTGKEFPLELINEELDAVFPN